MKRKSFGLTAALLACAMLVLSACGQNGSNTASNTGSNNESASSGKIPLRLWYWNGAISDSTIEAAKAKFPNIDLQAEKLPSGDDYFTKLKATLVGGSDAPDIVAMDSWVSSMLTYKDKFVNLYDQGARDIQPQYLDWKWKLAATPDDKYLIGLPIDVAPVVLYYRTDLLQKAGVPNTPEEVGSQVKSWDDYLALLKKVKDATGAATGNIVDIYNTVMGQSDKSYFDEQGNYIGDQAHVKSAYDLAVKAYQDGLTFPYSNGSEQNAAINNGKIAMFTGASWAVGDLISAAPDTKGKWNIAHPPGNVGNQGGSFFGALSSTKHPKEAYELIQFLVSPENLLTAYKEFGNYPSTPEIYSSPGMVNKNEFFGDQDLSPVFADAAKDVKIAHSDSRDLVAGTAISDALVAVDKKHDPEKSWKEAQDKIKKQLSH
ncbi:extracellular solute-binding protein [Paenibacillus lycopersici]|uniref:Extracellular solute-binding protein n=1 Tax=Paenibacillus lycopersici TaxID=2704462 RepID=A0A6C0G776_9BACL|nr:extracellular solute-binding protein [Paenibacillus lycopersici]QHT63165.1 extracellular solute-binding protein [Paenibacillus lycopersici]